MVQSRKLNRNSDRNCFSVRSTLERILIFFVILLFVVIIGLTVFHLFKPREGVCTTSACVSAANHILEFIDPAINPCDDFYKFVCGSYLKTAFEYNQPSMLAAMKQRTGHQIDAIIKGSPEENTVNSVKLMRQFFQSCINTKAIEEDQNETFLRLLDSLGGWPVTKGYQWEEGMFEWKDVMIKSRRLGFTFERLLEIGVDVSYGLRRLKISHPFGVEAITYEKAEPYVELMVDIAYLLGAPTVGNSGELRRAMHFQNELAKITEKSINANENFGYALPLITISKLQNEFPKTPWLQFINNVTDVITIRDYDLIAFGAEVYLKDLEILLLKTSKRIQANYIMWKIVETNIPYLTKDIRDRYWKFEMQFPKSKKILHETRKDVCLRKAKGLFRQVAEAEYIRKNVDSEKRQEVRYMFDQIKQGFLRRLESSPRLNREYLADDYLDYIRNVTVYIGGSDAVFDTAAYEKILGFDQLEFLSTDIINIYTKLAKNGINNYYAQIDTYVDEYEEFLMEALISMNAFYLTSQNILMLAAPLLQDNIYNRKRPNYLNYGALGFNIGHEFAHSLAGMEGLSYVNGETYTIMVDKLFRIVFGNVSCFITNYDEFTNGLAEFQNITVDGEATLEENMADYIGTDVAYSVYQKYVEERGAEHTLPGVNYTPNQLFWMMSAMPFCLKEELNGGEKIKYGVHHAEGIYRTNNRLRHSSYFAKDFECPTDSYMNPLEKCQIL